jgi:hypothetical protein
MFSNHEGLQIDVTAKMKFLDATLLPWSCSFLPAKGAIARWLPLDMYGPNLR